MYRHILRGSPLSILTSCCILSGEESADEDEQKAERVNSKQKMGRNERIVEGEEAEEEDNAAEDERIVSQHS